MGKNKNQKKSNKQVWQEVKREGIFSDAFKRSKVKKKYKFRSVIDAVLSIALILLAAVLISWVRSW